MTTSRSPSDQISFPISSLAAASACFCNSSGVNCLFLTSPLTYFFSQFHGLFTAFFLIALDAPKPNITPAACPLSWKVGILGPPSPVTSEPSSNGDIVPKAATSAGTLVNVCGEGSLEANLPCHFGAMPEVITRPPIPPAILPSIAPFAPASRLPIQSMSPSVSLDTSAF